MGDDLASRRQTMEGLRERVLHLENQHTELMEAHHQLLDLVMRSNHTQDDVNRQIAAALALIFEESGIDPKAAVDE